jgi:O-antigen ligase
MIRGVSQRRRPLTWLWWLVGVALAIFAGQLGAELANGRGRTELVLAGVLTTAVVVTLGGLHFRMQVLAELGALQAVGIMVMLPGIALCSAVGMRLTANMTFGDPFIALGVLIALCSMIERRRAYLPIWMAGAAACLIASWCLTEGFPGAFREPYITADGLTRYAGPGLSLGQATPLLLFAGVMLLLPPAIGELFRSPRLARMGARAFVAGTTVSGLVGIADRFFHISLGSSVTGLQFSTFAGDVVRTAGLATQPNEFALTLLLSAPIALSLSLTARGGLERWLCLGIVGVDALGVLISGSRSGAAAFAVALVVLPLLHPLRRGVVILGGLTVAATVAAVITLTAVAESTQFVTVDRLNSSTITYQSDALRSEMYSNGLHEVASHPWRGIGYEALRASHDIYLQMLQGGGILTLVGFLVFMGGVLSVGIGLSRSHELPVSAQNLSAALVAANVAWLAYAIVQPAILDRFLYIPAGLIFALASARQGARTG